MHEVEPFTHFAPSVPYVSDNPIQGINFRLIRAVTKVNNEAGVSL